MDGIRTLLIDAQRALLAELAPDHTAAAIAAAVPALAATAASATPSP
jgi:hypothetical protein